METVGLTTAAAALDAAIKAAEVQCVGVEKVIGVDKIISVTVSIVGDVAAVQAAVDAGVMAASAVGKVVSSHVIPRPHSDVDKLIEMFRKDKGESPQEKAPEELDEAAADSGLKSETETSSEEPSEDLRARRA
ncbi:Carboxysome shell and ethanolamine utilization microcompartment protein CcmL/EutN [Acidaminobacter hydrogenoformans DSM 2784]|uniref:Carboxysome shell and ethanolamine utilization microcompartment protein CcmL/EutN n=2 Tax=Acidaminobacter TaxID=65402 RepID=A0A1G5S5N9_9FIRM|nr:Carboxysome shell and ethanolamine utilization microcompartment protein CcmL/EutN [Acidaminobacter hydrogenoformans DSM 2784]